MSLAVRLVLLAAALAAGLFIFLLATASTDPAFLARHTLLLVGLNAFAAAVLLLLVASQLRRLFRDRRRGVFGSKLKARLLAMLASMAVMPGIVVFAVSLHFSAKSIDAWFDPRVESALSGGLALGRELLDELTAELIAKGRTLALDLADMGAPDALSLDRERERLELASLVLLSPQGQPLAAAGGDYLRLWPQLPDPTTLREARRQGGIARAENDAGGRLVVRAIVPVGSLALASEPRYLLIERPVPEALAKNAASIEEAWRDYQQLQLGKSGMKRLYALTLTFALLLALFAAVALAFFLADRLAKPLLLLVEGTRAVAAGDFTPRATLASDDELGELTRSFNAMTQQLERARAERDAAQRAIVWGEVARRLAHEIKNPLTPIQLSAERLQRKLADRLDEEGRAILARATKTIVDQVEAMKNMVNDFRDYARLPPPKLLPLDLSRLAREVASLYEGGPHAVIVEGQPAWALADADQLRQVLHNLIKNALEASADSPERAAVRLATAQERAEAILAVSDRGHGFPEEILARACEPYVTTKPKGTGLGLAIVKKIVADHGGQLILANRPEGGAEVRVILPAATPPAP